MIYPLIALGIFYSGGCSQNKEEAAEERFQNCAEAVREMREAAREEGWNPDRSFPDMDFGCEAAREDYQ